MTVGVLLDRSKCENQEYLVCVYTRVAGGLKKKHYKFSQEGAQGMHTRGGQRRVGARPIRTIRGAFTRARLLVVTYD